MSFYDTQTYCGIVDMKVVVVGICNKINFTKVWITPTYRYFLNSEKSRDIHLVSVKLAKCMYSQYTCTLGIFSFLAINQMLV